MATLEPMGDDAFLIRCPSEQAAQQLARSLQLTPPEWLIDVVPAYATIGVFVDMTEFPWEQIHQELQQRLDTPLPKTAIIPGCLHEIPCCYTLQLDLDRVAQHLGRTPQEIIALHTRQAYTVHAIGFCPGFPYLGYLPEALCGVSRLPSPRLRVEPGSVGLTGKQTGIYPLARPGGWNIIGRTPLVLVDVAADFFPLRVGDRIRFRAIDEHMYQDIHGQRLIRPDHCMGPSAESSCTAS